MKKILIIGGVSIDTLHVKNKVVRMAGGAGIYTGLAALRSGVDVSLFAPRPEPLPVELAEIDRRISKWNGPRIGADEAPHFEIEYHGEQANYLNGCNEAEANLQVDQLPDDLPDYDWVHVTPLGDAKKQLEFMQACRQRGAKHLSGGTYLCTARENPEVVRQALELTDAFFMNETEAAQVFGSIEKAVLEPRKILFVTLGSRGCLVIQGLERTRLPAVPARVADLTGAGDVFCGGVLAGRLLGEDWIVAAQRGTLLAAMKIGTIGLEGLLH